MDNPKNKVLLVEDNMINATVASHMLASICEVFHAENDQEAFDFLKEHEFGLILMDINLGGDSKDGTTIMQELRQQVKYKNLPIIAVTGYALPDDRERFIESGFDEYISKPVGKAELLNKVTHFLGNQQLAASA